MYSFSLFRDGMYFSAKSTILFRYGKSEVVYLFLKSGI